MATERKIHQRRIQSNLERALSVLEESLAGWAGDPKDLDVQTVYSLCKQRIKVETGQASLSASEQLRALGDLESWYADRGVSYPHPDRLKEQREFWQERVNES